MSVAVIEVFVQPPGNVGAGPMFSPADATRVHDQSGSEHGIGEVRVDQAHDLASPIHSRTAVAIEGYISEAI
jgi:hypothetical protein